MINQSNDKQDSNLRPSLVGEISEGQYFLEYVLYTLRNIGWDWVGS